jgi:anti-sigma B factor antagonist
VVALPSRGERETVGEIEVVRIDGELDQASVPAVREAIDGAIESASRGVLVDLSGCGFIDSSGLSLIVDARRRLDAEGASFGVCSPTEDVRRLLALTGIDAVVALYETREAAVTALVGAS